jgi:hypothetical protein
MFLGNIQPKTMLANGLLTAGAAAFGGTAAALGYRMSGNRAYQAAQQAVGMAGVNPQQAAGALRVNGKLGRFGEMEINLPMQTVIDAARAWRSITNPSTPDIVDQWFEAAAKHASDLAAAGFVHHMPPPNMVAQPAPQQVPVYMYPPPPQPQQAPPPAGQ